MALSADRSTPTKSGGARRHGKRGVAAGVVIFLGALLGKDAAGYLVPASDAAAISIVGISEQHVDNTAGDAGDVTCAYVTGVEAELVNAGGAIVQASLGKPCYVASDEGVTTAAVAVHDVLAGIVQAFTATKVWVFIDEAYSNAALAVPLNGGGIDTVAEAEVDPVALELGLDGVLWIPIPDAETSTYVFKSASKIRIIDSWLLKDGASAASTIQLTDAAAAPITNAMAAAVDKTITRAGTIDPAKDEVAAGGTFKVVATRAAGSMAADLFIRCIKLA